MKYIPIYMQTLLLAALLFNVGCGGGGGGGGGGGDIELTELLGRWSGEVGLVSNTCPRDIPVQSISFTHDVSLEITTLGTGDIELLDLGVACRGLNTPTDSDTFVAVCPKRPLIDFVDGYECDEEIVWTYSLNGATGAEEGSPSVIRTSFVRCFRGEADQFACPVEYRGSASRCLRDICPVF